MHIAYVCTDDGVPVFGRKGCSVHVREVLRAFVNRGHQVTLFASRLGGERPSQLRNIGVIPLAARRDGDAQDRETRAYAANTQLRETLRQAGTFDLVYERFSLWSHGAMEFSRDFGLRSVLEVNAPLIDEEATHRRLVDRPLAEAAARRAFSAAQVVAAVSEEVAQWVRDWAVPDAHVRVVTNGVCPDRITPTVPPLRPDLAAQFTVGFVGSMRPWHGLDQLLDAFLLLQRRCADAQLLIVGDGPQREPLMQRIGSLPRDIRKQIHLTGAVPVEEIPGWLTSMRIAVAPYPADLTFYFSPLKVFEYMAAGRAVVASGVGQLNSVLHHGRNGLLARPGDARSLADALVMLHGQTTLAAKLGAAARRTVVENHTWDRAVEQLIDVTTPSGPILEPT